MPSARVFSVVSGGVADKVLHDPGRGEAIDPPTRSTCHHSTIRKAINGKPGDIVHGALFSDSDPGRMTVGETYGEFADLAVPARNINWRTAKRAAIDVFLSGNVRLPETGLRKHRRFGCVRHKRRGSHEAAESKTAVWGVKPNELALIARAFGKEHGNTGVRMGA